MKKKIHLVLATAVLATAFQASAISEHYRQQLARSGCTQVTDGNGCDIHKSKAENASASHHPTDAVNSRSLKQTLPGKSVAQATRMLKSTGWRPSDENALTFWNEAQQKTLRMKVDPKTDTVTGISVK